MIACDEGKRACWIKESGERREHGDAGGFDGEPILDFEGDPRDPVPALKKCVDVIRQEFA